MNRRIFTFLIIVIILITTGCGNNNNSSKDTKDTVIAKVNGEEIMKSEFDVLMEQMKNYYLQLGMNLDSDQESEAFKNIETQVLNDLIEREAVLQVADKSEIVVTDEEVKEGLAQFKAQFPEEGQYEEVLEANNLTLEELEIEIKNDLKYNKYLESQLPEITATEDEIKQLYEQVKAEETTGQKEEEIQKFPKFEEVKEQVKQGVIDRKTAEAKDVISKKIVAQSNVEIM